MERYNISKQLSFIDYRKSFAVEKGLNIWLGGSFKKGTATAYSDVDVYINCNENLLKDFIYGRGRPVYIAATKNPEGILTVIYENGLALDLRVVRNTGTEAFSLSDGKTAWNINSQIYKSLPGCCGTDTAGLFHRAMIKYLRGKSQQAFSLLSEIAREAEYKYIPTGNFARDFAAIMKIWKEKYPLDSGLEKETEYLQKELIQVKTEV